MRPSRPFVVAILILAVATAAWWLPWRAKTHASSDRLTAEIRTIVHGKAPASRPTEVGSKQIWAQVGEFYRRRGHHAAWCRDAGVAPEAIQVAVGLT